jgi:hypothetical protein
MADEEREHNARMLRTYRANLQRALEKKAGFGGLNVPTWLENEIAEARTQVAYYEPLVPPPKQQDTAEKVSGSIDLTTLYTQGAQIAAEQARQADQNKDIIEQQVRDALWRLQAKEVIDEVVERVGALANLAEHEQKIRIQRQQEHDERMTTGEIAQAEIRDLVDALAKRIGGMWWLIFDAVVVVGLVVALVMWWFG